MPDRPCLIVRTYATRLARALISIYTRAHRVFETQPYGRLSEWQLRLTLCGGADYPNPNTAIPSTVLSPTTQYPSNPRGAALALLHDFNSRFLQISFSLQG